MTIIPQVIINDAKYLFKDFMNDLFYTFSEYKYTSLVLSFSKKISELIINVFKYSIKLIDDLFTKSEYRQKHLYINKQNGINILDIILKSLNKDENYIYNEKEVSFAIFDRDTNLLLVCSTKNPISFVLNKIAYKS